MKKGRPHPIQRDRLEQRRDLFEDDRYAFLAKPRVELTIDLPVRLRKQIGEMLGDGFAGRFGQGFELRNRDFG
jgi:hypothetical protein